MDAKYSASFRRSSWPWECIHGKCMVRVRRIDRTIQVYMNGIGNIERGQTLQTIRGRIGQLIIDNFQMSVFDIMIFLTKTL